MKHSFENGPERLRAPSGAASPRRGLRICLAGGGTGGHFYPLLAIAEALRAKRPNAKFVFLGARVGVDEDLCEAEGVEYELLSSRPLPHGVSARWPGALCGLALGALQAWRILRRVEPDLVVGTGGYVCASVVPAARLLGVPVLLHDSDAHPGRTTRALARWADAVTVAYESAAAELPAAKTCATGQPVRKRVLDAHRQEALARFGFEGDKRVLLVTGGSRGARSLNAAVLEALPRLARRGDLQVLHLAGRLQYPSVVQRARAAEQNGAQNYQIHAYLDDMEHALAVADIVLCRAGSSCLAEAAARGLPAIVVPYPHAAAHQEANARPLAEAGAAIVVPDGALTGQTLAELVEELLDEPGRLRRMSRAARAAAAPNAAGRIADIALGIVEAHGREADG